MTRNPAPLPVTHHPRRTTVGATTVARALPQRARRSVGHWCFVDVFTPGVGTDPAAAMGVGPHPHCGLETVTWLTDGALHHTDSLGSSQQIQPGTLNLMTAGAGITHAEAVVGSGPVHGAQLWLAQPEATRHGPPRFAHHAALPTVPVGPGVEATVVIGTLGSERSPANPDAPARCLSVRAPSGGSGSLELDGSWEHAVVVLDGRASVAGSWAGDAVGIGPGAIAVLDPGHHEVTIDAAPATTLLVLGGAPVGEPLVMWWNFVVRTPLEAHEAAEAWNRGDVRFGPLPPSPDPRIPAPLPPWAGRG